MKKRLKTILGCIAVVLACALVLGLIQAIVVPKYVTSSLEGNLISEYYNETTAHDVLFIGDCEVYECFTPPTLWEEYGITSYVRGSAQQLTWQSYYLLKESLKRETPRVVVFNVLALKYGEPQSEAYNRMTLDGMQWSWEKVEAIRASMTEEESFLSYVFPLLRFHSRWSEVCEEDLKYLFSKPTVSYNGYLMQTDIKPMEEEIEPFPLTDYTLPEASMYYLEQMRLLCEENGVEFVLIKAPTNSWRYYWYDEWDAQICRYAEEKDVDYYNFIPLCEEIGIDWSTDTYDAGAHLNVYGAEKMTAYFGKLLAEKYQIADHRGTAELEAVWAEKVEAYYIERDQKKD